jgi:predicted membrane chloride channel (bestrophin family)
MIAYLELSYLKLGEKSLRAEYTDYATICWVFAISMLFGIQGQNTAYDRWWGGQKNCGEP